MLTPEVQQYISQQRSAGTSDDQIRQNLVGQGWKEGDINKMLKNKIANGLVALTIFSVLLVPVVLLIFVFGGIFLADTKAGANYALLSMGAGILYPILLIILGIFSWKRNTIGPILILFLLYVLPIMYLFIFAR